MTEWQQALLYVLVGIIIMQVGFQSGKRVERKSLVRRTQEPAPVLLHADPPEKCFACKTLGRPCSRHQETNVSETEQEELERLRTEARTKQYQEEQEKERRALNRVIKERIAWTKALPRFSLDFECPKCGFDRSTDEHKPLSRYSPRLDGYSRRPDRIDAERIVSTCLLCGHKTVTRPIGKLDKQPVYKGLLP